MAEYGGVSDYQILQHYLQTYHNKGELKPGVNIQNPLTTVKQETPSFGIGKGIEGDYIYKDFATSDQGTAVNLVMELFGLNFRQAIEKIEIDFGTQKQAPKKYDTPVEVEVTFDIEFKQFTEDNLAFWQQGGINAVDAGILCVNWYKRNDEKANKIASKEEDPIFAYKVTDNCYKLYRPLTLDKRFKFGWLGKKPSEYVYGYDKLPSEGEICILCAGEKDTETAIAYGYPAICLNSESALPSSDLLFDINSRFKIFACCYDLDKTGREQTDKLKKLGLAPIDLPDSLLEYGNDLFDFAKNKDKFDVTFNDLVETTKAYNRYAVFNKPYRMTLDLDVPQGAITMRFKGATFLKKGNIATIVAGAGIGKSQTCDAISALVLNQNCDALGFEFVDDNVKSILHVDTERDPDDHKLGYLNIFRRANVELRDDDNLNYWSYKMNENALKNRELLQKMLNDTQYDLIIIDGIGDFIDDINDNKETGQFINWLTIFAQRNNTSVVITVHENINSNGRANGHLGTILWKKSYAMLRLQNNKEDNKIKEITNEFDLGKLRVGTNSTSGYIASHFYWNGAENINMYVSLSDEEVANMQQASNPKKTDLWYMNQIFYNTTVAMTKEQISQRLMEDHDINVNKVGSLIKSWTSAGYLTLYNGVYQLGKKEESVRIPTEVVSSEFEFNKKEEQGDPPF